MATKRLWRWHGIDGQGMPCQGTLWQDNRPEALQSLERERIIPLTLRSCSVQKSLWHPRYSGEVIRQLAALLQAGLPLAEGLDCWRSSSLTRSGRHCCKPWLRIWRKAFRFQAPLKNGPKLFLRFIWQ